MSQSDSFRTIVADPPWPIRWDGGKGGRRRRAVPLAYDLMSIEDICALPVGEMAMAAAHLYLWTTDELLQEGTAVHVVRAWGFEPLRPTLIWRKPNFGMGHFPRFGHEPCVIARRGNLPFRLRDVHSVQTWSQRHGQNNGGKVHSAKPEGFLDLVERASPGPYAELFSRRARFGWSYPIGDQSLERVVV